MSVAVVGRPEPSEYAPYYESYVSSVEGDLLSALEGQLDTTLATLRAVSPEESLGRYAPGKWSVREVIGHLIDTERVFAYRALRFARKDPTPLAGFEVGDYVPAGQFDDRPWPSLLAELELVRRASVLMLRGLARDAWLRRGVASEKEFSVRALAYVIAGHELHHMEVVRGKYLAARCR